MVYPQHFIFPSWDTVFWVPPRKCDIMQIFSIRVQPVAREGGSNELSDIEIRLGMRKKSCGENF